jgi:hypothetical protein
MEQDGQVILNIIRDVCIAGDIDFNAATFHPSFNGMIVEDQYQCNITITSLKLRSQIRESYISEDKNEAIVKTSYRMLARIMEISLNYVHKSLNPFAESRP